MPCITRTTGALGRTLVALGNWCLSATPLGEALGSAPVRVDVLSEPAGPGLAGCCCCCGSILVYGPRLGIDGTGEPEHAEPLRAVLLHEMIHATLHRQGVVEPWHGDAFRQLADRLADALNWPRARPGLTSIATWPLSVRWFVGEEALVHDPAAMATPLLAALWGFDPDLYPEPSTAATACDACNCSAPCCAQARRLLGDWT
jgi:hypothetical protein